MSRRFEYVALFLRRPTGLTGFPSRRAPKFVHDSLLDNFYIEGVSVSGAATLSATDIDASAHLGPLSIHVVDGTGSATVESGFALPAYVANVNGFTPVE